MFKIYIFFKFNQSAEILSWVRYPSRLFPDLNIFVSKSSCSEISLIYVASCSSLFVLFFDFLLFMQMNIAIAKTKRPTPQLIIIIIIVWSSSVEGGEQKTNWSCFVVIDLLVYMLYIISPGLSGSLLIYPAGMRLFLKVYCKYTLSALKV